MNMHVLRENMRLSGQILQNAAPILGRRTPGHLLEQPTEIRGVRKIEIKSDLRNVFALVFQ
jgi:hypothetical protein